MHLCGLLTSSSRSKYRLSSVGELPHQRTMEPRDRGNAGSLGLGAVVGVEVRRKSAYIEGAKTEARERMEKDGLFLVAGRGREKGKRERGREGRRRRIKLPQASTESEHLTEQRKDSVLHENLERRQSF